MGRSLFGLPGWLHGIVHTGITNCYAPGMASTHPTAQIRRLGHLRALDEHTHIRERVLTSAPTGHDSATLLAIRMICSGHWEVRHHEHGVTPRGLPPMRLEAFRIEQEEAHRLGTDGHTDLRARLRPAGTGHTHELPQYVLSTRAERHTTDAAQEAVGRRGGQPMPFEHGGRYIYVLRDATTLVRCATAEAGYTMAVNAHTTYGRDVLPNTAQKLAGGGGRGVADSCGTENGTLAREVCGARTGTRALFTDAIITEPHPGTAIPWRLHDLFKLPAKVKDGTRHGTPASVRAESCA